MRVVVTGATGLIGRHLVVALRERGDSVTALSRDPDRASSSLGIPAAPWDPLPADTLSGADGVVNLAGAPVAQRWSSSAKDRIRSSRVDGTSRLVAGLGAGGFRGAFVSASAAGYYGVDPGSEPLDESSPAGEDFLARVCVEWERAALGAAQFGARVALVRTGIVLDSSGGALARMLPPFRLGLGGPAAGGKQYMSWIALDDLVGVYIAALTGGEPWSGPFNACAPEAVTNAEFARALGRVLHRPTVLPLPGVALRLAFGEMASIVTGGQRMVPARLLREAGFEFRHAELESALQASLNS